MTKRRGLLKRKGRLPRERVIAVVAARLPLDTDDKGGSVA
jgi:hypothetical protein